MLATGRKRSKKMGKRKQATPQKASSDDNEEGEIKPCSNIPINPKREEVS